MITEKGSKDPAGDEGVQRQDDLEERSQGTADEEEEIRAGETETGATEEGCRSC